MKIIKRIQKPLLKLMSVPNEENLSSQSQLSSHFFLDLLDSIIVDVASECHRIAKLGLDANLEEEDEELKLSAQARVRMADPGNSNETNGKYVVDIFGQTHPSVANEIFECMNCSRSIMAGKFAPHLEKCMGKGRKARLKVTRSSSGAQNRNSRGSSVSTYSNHSSNNSSVNRLTNGNPSFAGEEHSNGASQP
ncbi:SAGA-associated factor-like protein isoform X2 [Cicer arietinum]|uniref:SAGA-associated factor 11 n=1 Tax=Cicer arietinum TaxID=3827 RepID=A0A3Q7XR25_CICAR|nr:SAGA-associated factor-like protein isoform X2 [Cicer arietinum]